MKNTNRYMLVTIAISMCMSLVIYCQFIFGDVFYVGSTDSAYQFLSYLTYYGRKIDQGNFPAWSFQVGLGEISLNRYIGDPFFDLIFIFGEKMVPYMLVYVQVIKCVLTTLFMFLYLKRIKISNKGAMIGSLAYSYSSVMMVRGIWFHFATEVFLLSVILWSLEKYFQENRIISLTLSLALMYTHGGIYYIVLYSVLCCVYAIVRYYIVNKQIDKLIVKYLFKGLGIVVLAGAISCIINIPQLIQTLNTSRLEAIIDGDSISLLASSQRWWGAWNSFFSGTLTNGYGAYGGPFSNGLDGPKFYVGVIFVIINLLVCELRDKKIKKLIYAFYIFLSVYIASPLVSYVCNLGVSKNYFKLSTLWMCVGLIIIGVYVIDNVVLKQSYSKKTILFIAIFTVALLILSSLKIILKVNKLYLLVIFLLIVLYCVVLFISYSDKKYFNLVIVLLVFELTVSAVNTSNTVAGVAAAMNMKKIDGYGTRGIELDIEDSEKFYRVAKIENYGSRALFFDINGIGYCDDISKSYVDFIDNVIDKNVGHIAHQYEGYEDDYWILDTLLGVKYRVVESQEPYIIPSYYSIYKEDVKYNIVKNENAFPLGVMYDNLISYDLYEKMDYKTRQYNLLNSIVVEGDAKGDIIDYPYTEVPCKLISLDEALLTYEEGVYTLKTNEEVVNLFLQYDSTGSKLGTYVLEFQVRSKNHNFNVCNLQVYDGNIWHNISALDDTKVYEAFWSDDGEYVIAINGINPKAICLQFQNALDTVKISDINMYLYDVNKINDDVNAMTSVRRHQGMLQLHNFEEDYIAGSIDSTVDGIMFLSIPYHDGWTAYVDGIETKIQKVNYGFCGVQLSEGHHNIELRFELPGLKIATVISVLGLITLLSIDALLKIRLRKS